MTARRDDDDSAQAGAPPPGADQVPRQRRGGTRGGDRAAAAPGTVPSPRRPAGPPGERRVADRRRTPAGTAQPPGHERRSAPRRAADQPACSRCGHRAVTSVEMVLADGTPVTFVSCHGCEHRAWFSEGTELSTENVLSRSAKRS